jgi:DNA-binding NtrC family response regulator
LFADKPGSRTDTTVHLAPIVPNSEEVQEERVPAGPISLTFDLPEPAALHPERWMLGPMVGRSAAIQHLFGRMRCTAPYLRMATVEGEPGSGKLLTARTFHQLGPAAAGPFAPWLAGEFINDPERHWKEAHVGLLYLSRIDEISGEQQRRLRDFLEHAAHQRIRQRTPEGPLQILAGSIQPLRRLAAGNSFRSDLASLLTAIRFRLPPLRDRRDDIPLLAALFLRSWTRKNSRPLRGFAPGTLGRLMACDWPGNVRELESALAAAALDCPGQWIRPIDLPQLEWPGAPIHPSANPSLEDPNLDRAILRHVARVLARVNGNKVRAARLLGISRSTLYRLLDSSRAASGEALPAPSAP